MNKINFPTKKYFSKNIKLSKFHAVTFMIAGFIILIFLIYISYYVWGEGLKSIDWGYECSGKMSEAEEMSVLIKTYQMEKFGYYSNKNQYNSAETINSRIDTFNLMIENYDVLIENYNNIVDKYNSEIDFYDHCYNSSVSEFLDDGNNLLDSEGYVLDSISNDLSKERAIASVRDYYAS